MHKKKLTRRKPELWWGMEGDSIIVESDDPCMRVVASIKYNNTGEFGCARTAINIAERLIDELNSGRKSFKSLGFK